MAIIGEIHAMQLQDGLSLAIQHPNSARINELSAGWLLNGKAIAFEALNPEALAKPGGNASQAGPRARKDPWVELEAARRSIPGDAVLIDIARLGVRIFNQAPGTPDFNPPEYYAWVIPPLGKGDIRVIRLEVVSAVAAAVLDFKKSIASAEQAIFDDGPEAATAVAEEKLATIAKHVLGPLEPSIGHTQRWLICPDALLWDVPWAALPLAGGGHVFERHEVSYLLSGRELVAPHRPPSPGAAVILADPDFDESCHGR